MQRKSRYLVDRQARSITKWGLCRRTEMVIQQLQQLDLPRLFILLDVGTADGQMLSDLLKYLGSNSCTGVGVDVRFSYLRAAREKLPCVVQADGRRLPLRTGSVDVIISTAVFKHIVGLEKLIAECHRVLKSTGIMVVMDPTPWGVQLGLLLGYFSEKEIQKALNLRATQCILIEYGFRIIHAECFMLSPIPFAGLDIVERMLKRMHLDKLFLCQVVCAQRAPAF